MAKKKQKRKNVARPALARTGAVTLSQCMIVKDEERNIEKALSWGRGIACEQIVVDTGSTDRTVEIAQRMGAKVHHFEWVNDFAAAKNYAIEKATGMWIAFLDADEYIAEDEIGIVMPFLELIHSDPKTRKNYLAVNCPWIQLDDKGKPKDVLSQERIFRNLQTVRYVGKIHEKLSLELKDVVHTRDFRIMHTGYTGESFIVTGKASRNVELLRAEIKDRPGDMNLKAYLAESLKAEVAVEKHNTENQGEAKLDAEKVAEVESLYREVLESGAKIYPMLKQGAYDYFIHKYMNSDEEDPWLEDIFKKAVHEFPREHKFMCYHAMMLNKAGDYRAALDVLKKCEQSLIDAMGSYPALTTTVMGLLTAQMVLAAQGLGDTKTVLDYAEIMLLMEKTNVNVLRPFIATLIKQHSSLDDVIGVLARIYDMSSKRDLLLIARAAKDCGAIEFVRRIIDVAGYLADD